MSVIAWKVPLFVVLLVPFAMILSDALLGTLGADPVARLEQRTGDWALRLLLTQLYDPDMVVQEVAVRYLEEACEAPDVLEMVVEMHPTLEHLGDIGHPLLLK